jgi:hypothetical protein
VHHLLHVPLQVYDFALPLLVLHAFHFQTGSALRHWLRICPRRQFTVSASVLARQLAAAVSSWHTCQPPPATFWLLAWLQPNGGCFPHITATQCLLQVLDTHDGMGVDDIESLVSVSVACTCCQHCIM